MRIAILAGFLMFVTVLSHNGTAQTADPKLQFEVASIKVSATVSGPFDPSKGRQNIGQRGGPGTNQPEQLTIGSMQIKNLLLQAFGVKALQLSGPSWLDNRDNDRFDVVAKVPPGASKEDAKLMLQNLLVDRFGLQFHRETKDVQGYELVVGKNGPKMKESLIDPNPPPPPAAGGQPFKIENDRNGIPQLPAGRPGTLMGGGVGGSVIAARQQTMTQLANILENQLGKPVVDKTGLTAKYDFGIKFDPTGLPGAFAPQNAPPGDASDPVPSIFTVVQQELGLRLDQKKITVDLV